MYVLTMVFLIIQNNPAATTVTQEYTSRERCVAAMDANREALSGGKVILATCTQK